MGDEAIIGFATRIAIAAARAAAINQAAAAEGITYEEMRLRGKAARYQQNRATSNEVKPNVAESRRLHC
jgi:hypothetical protein